MDLSRCTHSTNCNLRHSKLLQPPTPKYFSRKSRHNSNFHEYERARIDGCGRLHAYLRACNGFYVLLPARRGDTRFSAVVFLTVPYLCGLFLWSHNVYTLQTPNEMTRYINAPDNPKPNWGLVIKIIIAIASAIAGALGYASMHP